MLVVNVEIRVKSGKAEEFIVATRANVEQSRREPGIASFDLLVDPDDGHHFLLVEVYRTAEAPELHKQTSHYQAWRDAVTPMMQVARSSAKWATVLADYKE